MLTFVLKQSQQGRKQPGRLTKISPDGVQLYVSRPCAQGRLFSLYTVRLQKNSLGKTKGLNVKFRLF